ncbi:MAG: acyclic terpene utilization AtuA family protein [Rhodovulum sp.]|nr:acyclic terpene utilization AtuA family protein [Rhodovulum sp.]
MPTTRAAPLDEFRILSPTAILGYGFPEASFAAGLARDPHVIAVDAGSSDPGPYYLGAGEPFTDRAAVTRDLRLMLRAGRARNIPVIVGSAGGCGARPHLDITVAIVREIAAEEGLSFRLAVIAADIDRDALLAAQARGALVPLPPGPEATADDVRASTHLVAQMGAEPLVAALAAGADVIVAGRAYDPAVFAALPLAHGFDAGLAVHLGKILECAAIAAVPGSGGDCMLGTLRRDHFLVEPLAPERRCTVVSVAAHTLYEKSDPYRLPGPGGVLDLTATTFAQEDERTVRVAGSRMLTRPYTLKIEGAAPVGFRTVSIAGVRDPSFIAQVDTILDAARARVAANFAGTLAPESWRLLFRLYGRDGVMGTSEPLRTIATPHELGLIIEAVADSQAIADTIVSFARATLLHLGYPGRIATAGNLAFPYSPSDFHAGAVYRFSVYHLLTGIDDPCALFPITLEEVGARAVALAPGEQP